MVENLIRRARRRLLLNRALAQTAFAAAVSAGGIALLLILGTRYLEWWTIAVFAAAGVAVGIFRVSRNVPNPYATAVSLDQNASLQDTLSTAFYFSGHGSSAHGGGSPEFRESQKEQAEVAARSVSLEATIPFTFPRALYFMAALCLVASGLIALRYRIGRGLDLKRPITEVLFEDEALHEPKKQAQFDRSRPNGWAGEAQQLLAKLGLKPSEEGMSPSDPDALDKAIEQALQQPPNADGKSSPKGTNSEKAAQGKDGITADDTPGGDPIDGGEKKSGDPKDGDASADAKSGDPGEKGKPNQTGDDSKESLLDKLKDAVNNILAKSQPDQKTQQRAQDQKSAKNEPHKGDKKGEAGQGKPEKGDAQADDDDTDPNGDALGGQKGQGKEATASNQKQSQEGSGIGSQDGLKELKEAEQLKAMGKISEIIGKRSATVTGETSVEVQSGDQRLHTSYSKTDAAHAETDGDVTRDEIPLSLQAYVQQYFEEVHKTAAPKKAAAKTTP